MTIKKPPIHLTVSMQAAIKQAVEMAGGQSALAKLCGVRQGQVFNWLNRDKKVSFKYAIAVEKALKGKIKRTVLRPDIYPPRVVIAQNTTRNEKNKP